MKADETHPGGELRPDDAIPAEGVSRIMRRDETSEVLLAGPVGSGKTTILVALYELFNQGPVAGLLFAGSATLAGFERICHAGRAGSQRVVPDTIRTNPSSGAAFLHLRVADPTTAPAKTASLLVSDVTGEAFQDARDFAEPTMLPRSLWRRADVLCVLLDGGKFANDAKKHLVRTDARGLLRAARESRLLSPLCRLALVTTKWDLIVDDTTRSFVSECEDALVVQFGSDFQSVSRHRIAARPGTERAQFAYGVPGLLTDWISREPATSCIAIPNGGSLPGLSAFAKHFWEVSPNPGSGVLHAV
jgi:hypothetical protein